MNLVENGAVSDMRKKMFPGLPKTDEMDTRVMNRIGYLHEAVGEEFTLRPLELPDPDSTHLLALCRDSWKLSANITRARNQFTQLMAVIFPELKTFFTGSVSSIVPVKLVAAYPTPALLAEATTDEVKQCYGKQVRINTHIGQLISCYWPAIAQAYCRIQDGPGGWSG
jgi:hypothetical protein